MNPELEAFLIQRLSIIADHDFRDRDPAGHLQALRQVSEKLSDFTETHQSELDPKLRHYLSNSSYQKALDHITS